MSMQGDLWFHLVPRVVQFWVQKCLRAECRSPCTQPTASSPVTVMLALRILESFLILARTPKRGEKWHWQASLRRWGCWGSTIVLIFLRPGDVETISPTSRSSDRALMPSSRYHPPTPCPAVLQSTNEPQPTFWRDPLERTPGPGYFTNKPSGF